MKKLVDIDVWNCSIRANLVQERYQNMPIPFSDEEKMMFMHNCPADRLNYQKIFWLKGKALTQTRRIINKYGAINTSGIYGSIYVDEKDLVEMKN